MTDVERTIEPALQPAAESAYDTAARADLMSLFAEAIRAVSPAIAMPKALPPAPYGRTAVIAVGKGAAEMMRVAQSRAAKGQKIEGLVVTRYGHVCPALRDTTGIEIIESGHPFPDENSVKAAHRALEIAGELHAGDQLLVFLSGGGSALMAAPARGVTLEDKQSLTRALLSSGATIGEINTVRKHLSAVKGGRLAVAAGAAQITTWIISDVPGDDPSFVSSGPTVADDTNLATAREVLEKYAITPPPRITGALHDTANETPSPDTLGLAGGDTLVIARARDALSAAADLAREMGYITTNLGDHIQAEARHLGASHAALSRRLRKPGQRTAMISGGEATVHVVNPDGHGGRNLEYLLGLAIALQGEPGIHALAADTDGIDGTDDAAGAIVTPNTLARARELGLDPQKMLAENNAYRFFEALGDLVITGPTYTNVNDFRAILIRG
jgi:glycerate 2-kinase